MMAETDGVLDKMKSLFSAAFEHELHMTITKNVLFTFVWIKSGRSNAIKLSNVNKFHKTVSLIKCMSTSGLTWKKMFYFSINHF